MFSKPFSLIVYWNCSFLNSQITQVLAIYKLSGYYVAKRGNFSLLLSMRILQQAPWGKDKNTIGDWTLSKTKNFNVLTWRLDKWVLNTYLVSFHCHLHSKTLGLMSVWAITIQLKKYLNIISTKWWHVSAWFLMQNWCKSTYWINLRIRTVRKIA